MARDSLRCFLEYTGERWTAYCVEVALSTTGETAAAARMSLDLLLEQYWYEHVEPAVRPRVPWQRILRYGCARLRYGLRLADMARAGAACYRFREPPQPILGLA